MLDAPAAVVARTVRELLPAGPAKDALSGRWLGHAVHPLLTDVPIGMWTSSVLLDWAGGDESEAAADRLLVAGLLAAGATFASGWSDWVDEESGSAAVRRVGLLHADSNATATALMLRSYAAPSARATVDAAECCRSRGPRCSASAAGSAVTGATRSDRASGRGRRDSGGARAVVRTGGSREWLDQHAMAVATDHEPRARTPVEVLVTMPATLDPLHGCTASVARR